MFKAGDKVICIDVDGFCLLTLGGKYTIQTVEIKSKHSNNKYLVALEGWGEYPMFINSRFVPDHISEFKQKLTELLNE